MSQHCRKKIIQIANALQAYEKNQSEPPPVERPKKRKLEATISPIKTAPNMKKKKTAHESVFQEPIFSFKDVGGLDKTLEDVCKLLLHIRHPELYKKLGISPPRGFLLHGPPGCGKTLLANAIAGVSVFFLTFEVRVRCTGQTRALSWERYLEL